MRPKGRAFLPSPWGRSAPALPVADKAGVLRVQRSVCNAGVRAKAHTGNRKRKGDREAVDEGGRALRHMNDPGRRTARYDLIRPSVRTGAPSPKEKAILPSPLGRAYLLPGGEGIGGVDFTKVFVQTEISGVTNTEGYHTSEMVTGLR